MTYILTRGIERAFKKSQSIESLKKLYAVILTCVEIQVYEVLSLSQKLQRNHQGSILLLSIE